jgi:hypothetical protein
MDGIPPEHRTKFAAQFQAMQGDDGYLQGASHSMFRALPESVHFVIISMKPLSTTWMYSLILSLGSCLRFVVTVGLMSRTPGDVALRALQDTNLDEDTLSQIWYVPCW